MSPQFKAALASYGRAFLVAVLASFFALGKTPFDLTAADGKTLLAAGVVAVLAPLMRALNRKDTAFGLGSGEEAAAVE